MCLLSAFPPQGRPAQAGRPFRLHRRSLPAPVATVRPLTRILTVALVLVSAFAVWSWCRPYEWKSDPAARFKIQQVRVIRDHSNYWVDVFLKGDHHELEKRVHLESADGRLLEPADTRLSGENEKGITDLWFRFWLDARDFNGPLRLKLNDGGLWVRSGSGPPVMESGESKILNSNSW